MWDDRVEYEGGDALTDRELHPFLGISNWFIFLILLLQLKNWGHMIVIGAFFAVDSFLLLSSALLCYIFMKTMSLRGVKFNLPVYILHRYMR
jgi:hypothetical protein